MNKHSFISYQYILLLAGIGMLSVPIFLFAQITDEERARIQEQANAASMIESITEQALQNTQELIDAGAERVRDNLTTSNEADSTTRPVSTTDQVQSRINALEERRNQMRTDIANRQADIEARSEERRAVLQERAQERLLNLAANMSNRMEAAIRRLTNVSNRMESRISKLEDAGVNTTEARGHLTEARNHLTSASSALTNIDTDVVQFITSNDPRSAWVRVKSIYDTARTDIRSAHESLRRALASLGQAIADQQQTNTLPESE